MSSWVLDPKVSRMTREHAENTVPFAFHIERHKTIRGSLPTEFRAWNFFIFFTVIGGFGRCISCCRMKRRMRCPVVACTTSRLAFPHPFTAQTIVGFVLLYYPHV